MESRSLRVQLIKYFKAFRDAELVYYTSQGSVFQQDELEIALRHEKPDNLRMVTRREVFTPHLLA